MSSSMMHGARAMLAALSIWAAALTQIAATAAAKPPPRLPVFHIVPFPQPPTSPAGILSIRNTAYRHRLEQDLAELDLFLDNHPEMSAMRQRIWRLAETRFHIAPVALAGAVWCAVYAPAASRCAG